MLDAARLQPNRQHKFVVCVTHFIFAGPFCHVTFHGKIAKGKRVYTWNAFMEYLSLLSRCLEHFSSMI